ncbi:MAG: hypothetical protein JJE46_11535, partial [Acidimicrobiia bacterium]|nr:hypothetical protein [Acidimicrobiia bacterium]
MRAPRSLAIALLALGIVITTGAARAPVARAAETSTIDLAGQPAWNTLGDDVNLQLRVRPALAPGLDVVAQIHETVQSRISFERTLRNERLGSVISTRTASAAELPVVGPTRVLTLSTQDPNAPRDTNRIRFSIPGGGNAGVFPVDVQLRNHESGAVVDSFVTYLVMVRQRSADEVPNEPLQVAWVWHIAASPHALPPTGPSPLAGETAPNGRLDRLATSLRSLSEVPVTLSPSPETVDELRAASADKYAANVLAALRDASGVAPVLATSYVPVNGPSMTSAGLGVPFATQIGVGRTTLETGLNRAIDRTIAVSQPLDEPTLAQLRNDGGATRLVVDPSALAPAAPADQFTSARPFRLDTAAAGSFDAVESNPTASGLLEQRGADALRAQQVLASLSVIALEQPNRTRGVVLDTPLLWNPSPPRIATILAGLEGHPLLQGSTVAGLFETVKPATDRTRPYVRTLAPIRPPPPPVTEAQYSSGLRQVDALGSMIGSQDPVVVRLRHDLYTTVAQRVPGVGPDYAADRLAAISLQLRTVTGAITAPSSRSVQLTSRRASVPLSIENALDQTVRVRIALASQKLDFPEGSDRVLDLPPGNTTTVFDVEARASGTF